MTKEEEIAKLSIKINGSIIEIFANDEKSFYSNSIVSTGRKRETQRSIRISYAIHRLERVDCFFGIRFTAREKQTRE